LHGLGLRGFNQTWQLDEASPYGGACATAQIKLQLVWYFDVNGVAEAEDICRCSMSTIFPERSLEFMTRR
jgi:hypothetical protein